MSTEWDELRGALGRSEVLVVERGGSAVHVGELSRSRDRGLVGRLGAKLRCGKWVELYSIRGSTEGRWSPSGYTEDLSGADGVCSACARTLEKTS